MPEPGGKGGRKADRVRECDAVLAGRVESGPGCGEREVRLVLPLVWIPAGRFIMGSDSPVALPDERPARRVFLSRGFWLGQYPVTQAQWQAVWGSNPSDLEGEELPVVRASYRSGASPDIGDDYIGFRLAADFSSRRARACAGRPGPARAGTGRPRP